MVWSPSHTASPLVSDSRMAATRIHRHRAVAAGREERRKASDRVERIFEQSRIAPEALIEQQRIGDRGPPRFGRAGLVVIERQLELILHDEHGVAAPSPRCSSWPGSYRLDGSAFVYTDRHSRRVSTILGYPMHLLAKD